MLGFLKMLAAYEFLTENEHFEKIIKKLYIHDLRSLAKMEINRKWPSDLLIILILVLLSLVFVVVPVLDDTFIRTILGLPMVLFIPGYVLVAALFPKNDDIGAVERIALSVGLSIAVVSLLGLLLNFTFGIKLVPILFTLCIYSIVLMLIAAYRREKLPEEERFSISLHRSYEIIDSEINANRSRADKILTGILIFFIALAIGLSFFVIATPKTGERLTEFYILGPNGKVENYSTNLKYNLPSEILVGVVNHEYTSVNYTVRVALDKDVLSDTLFRLNNNETWEKNITFVPNKEGNNMKLEFWLFNEDNFTVPYRDLHLWVNVTK